MNNQISPREKGVSKISVLYLAMENSPQTLVPDDALHAVFLRSPVAVGKLNYLDCSDAKEAPRCRRYSNSC